MPSFTAADAGMMRLALKEAEEAAKIGEVPVGAVAVWEGEVISAARNRRETDKSALSHAELLAIGEACERLGGWRLHKLTLYVTLEPCPMCAGAIINARIARVVFGASDPKAGCFGSVADFCALPFNHRPLVEGGLLGEESALLLRAFFSALRS
ncbi:MAG: nucleoside deaminase [Oscillospiraceae bacterium]|jgi:tRNA(adenine34) deaminase|nr:nucleoside deaminase [Oscillospiraceae bacterium]